MKAEATYEIKSWDEKTWDGKPYNEVTGRKLTQAAIICRYQGAIEGEGTLHSLMFYREDGTASYNGLEQIVGSLGGKTGSFVIQHSGTYENGTATSTLTIVPGSGTGELVGLRGQGSSTAAGHQPSYPITLEYEFEASSS
ncbi:MAG: DUF3224 domain-containing protein [Anaerolineae bacterium]|nr:DUF3224 domain-containing protein [Anaerolineae bacterium]